MGLIHMDSTLQRFWSSHSIDWMATKGLLWGTINPLQKTFYGPADQQNATERGHSFDPLTEMLRRPLPLRVEHRLAPFSHKLTFSIFNFEQFSTDFYSNVQFNVCYSCSYNICVWILCVLQFVCSYYA